MKTIKTRSSVKNIKALDKSVNLSTRMKDTFVRTKEHAEETREPHSATPTDYAVDNIQNKAQGAARETVNRLPNPRHKARENIERAKGHFQEVKRQMPKERQRAAEQAQKTASKTKGSADNLRKTADQARTTANETKSAVKDAKQTLKQVRLEGKQTLREVKQNARLERSGKSPAGNAPKGDIPHSSASDRKGANPSRSGAARPKTASAPNVKPAGDLPSGISRPNYLNKGVRATKNAGDAAKTAEKSAKGVKSTAKGFKDTAKGTVKTAKKSVKTAEQTAKKAVKTAQQAAKNAQKTAQAAAKAAKIAEKAARAAAKAAVHTAKAAAKAVAAMVKAIIAAVKGLVALIAAGGWIVLVIILVICLIGLLIASIFSIFFSSEPSPGSGMTINGVITDINTEYTNEIDSIKNDNAHDLLDMSGARASWKEVLAVYTVKVTTDPDSPMEVATVDEEKAEILRSVFWEMNTITHTLDTVDVEDDVLGDDGLPTGETTTVSKTVLRITVSHKTPDEMAAVYEFSDEQKEQLAELLKPEYHSLWNALLYGITSIGDGTMIEIADTQIGNVGGEPYWSWYGFSSREEWCACFVSWVAEQCGFIEAGIMPSFAWCPAGVQWFKDREQWQDNTYTPRTGDIIFFDWEPDGECDHVGIVESVTDGVVNTIEGNTSDSVARRSYTLGSVKIYGYGTPEFP